MKKALIATLPVCLAAVVCLWFFGRPAYRHYKERRSLTQARRFLVKADYRNASLSARQALQANPSSLEACRLMAELAELAHSPVVVEWQRRIAELAPSPDNKLRYAAAALRVQGPPYMLARQLLEELRSSATNSADYHALAAELALKQNRLGEAAAHFEVAARLQPKNETHRLNLAVLGLRSTNDTVAAGARASLEQLCASTNLGAVALRWLVADRLEHKDLAAAERFSKQLLADSRCGLEDRLQHLNLLQQENAPGFGDFLRQIQQQAATNAGNIYALSTWMTGHGRPEEALAWLTNCPASLQAQQPVPLAFVDGFLARKDWEGLDSYLKEQKWGELEFLRLAFLSHAAAQQRQEIGADARWRSALREAGDRLGALTSLLGLASNWQRDKAREDLLWQIAQRFPKERWALAELERLYTTCGNTRGLNKVYGLRTSYDPKDFVARNNLAATCFLLKVNLSRGHELAQEVYAQHPEEGIVTSTYAYSLHLQGRTREGVAALEKLKPAALEEPSVALYYGYLLSAVGQTNQAAHFLHVASSGSFLPEEKGLLAEAASGAAAAGRRL